MILYNTLVGVLAGLAAITGASMLRAFRKDCTEVGRESRLLLASYPVHGLVLGVLGVPLLVLGVLMAVTWPLSANPPINIAFAEPAVLLAIVALGASVVGFHGIYIRDKGSIPTPFRLVFASVGGVLAMVASAVFSYDLVGDAPAQEPITGQFQGWENTTFGVVYALAALACLALAVWRPGDLGRLWSGLIQAIVYQVAYWSLLSSGVFFLLFSVLNYRTHIGLLINLEQGTDYRW